MRQDFFLLILVKDCEGEIVSFVKSLKYIPRKQLVILDQDSQDNTAQLARLLKAKVLLGSNDPDECVKKGIQRIKYYQPRKLVITSLQAWEDLHDTGRFGRMLNRLQNLYVTNKKPLQKRTYDNTIAVLNFSDVLSNPPEPLDTLLRKLDAKKAK